ncbi:hypothetical protein ACFYYR_07705 [Streptomyces sp. NPDC001922]|uniref:hypothetical protein n=1 Tax=Streptomyces sp. NPDC001922 TaxID=3364624 RepID=UPI0036BA95CB
MATRYELAVRYEATVLVEERPRGETDKVERRTPTDPMPCKRHPRSRSTSRR